MTISRKADYPYGYWQRQIVRDWERIEREENVERKKIWEERSGKVTAEVVEKDTGTSKWKELEVFRLYKDKEDKWRRAYGFGDRDIKDAEALMSKGRGILLGNTPMQVTDEEIDNAF